MELQDRLLRRVECPLQTLSIVADVINDCNHACAYCHPMESGRWGGGMLSVGQVGDVLRAGEEAGALEVLLTGGEITMHPEFGGIMEETAAWPGRRWPWSPTRR